MGAQSDKQWKQYGGLDPYYGVLAEEHYRKGNLDQAGLDRFFRTGEEHVEHVLNVVEAIFGSVPVGRALDFGCGVGRLVIPMAKRFGEVMGLDISEAMLREAKENCERRGVGNAVFELSDEALSQARGRFQFIHSFIVFQHILPRRGLALFERLVDLLEPGGIGAVQFCYHIELPWGTALKRRLLRLFPWLHLLLNIAKGRPLRYPLMEMNEYDCNRILALLQSRGIREVHTEFTDHGGHWGIFIYFKSAPGR